MPFSIFLITRNEEARLGQVLDAVVGLSDDIVVVDSGSDDGTVAIAEAKGARVFTAIGAAMAHKNASPKTSAATTGFSISMRMRS